MLTFEEIDQYCDRFIREWQKDSSITVQDFLESEELPQYPPLLDELILQEIELKKNRGLPLSKTQYLHAFPDNPEAVRSGFSRIENIHSNENNISTRSSDSGPSLFDIRTTDSDSNVPERLGKFKISEPIGKGSFGAVYKAECLETGEFVALKFPLKGSLETRNELEQFYNEASLASKLDHPAIVKTMGWLDEDDFLCIIQQYVDGTSLKKVGFNALSLEELIQLVSKVAEGAAYAHRAGLIHRDLKPANILIDSAGNPLIIDFGLLVHENFQRRLKGQRCGTPSYMSPEQVLGLSHQLDGRSDIWSLGVILYEQLTKRKPFQGDSDEELFEEIKFRNEKPIRMIRPDLDRELQRICMKCLSKSIRERYETADELATDLNRWLDSKGQRNEQSTQLPTLRGLRSFEPHDMKPFLNLLPGRCDIEGIPESINFWKEKLESKKTTNETAIGVVLGPTGSGKSSFMKAGLLPNLEPNLFTNIYCEATVEDFEETLLKQIRSQIPAVPTELCLSKVFDGLGNGQWKNDESSKIVIVIDQFEQWLHSQSFPESSPFGEAVRHCNKKHLECILLIRDDYWLRMSQFLNAIGLLLREGENIQRIDPFDKPHSTKVLHLLGSSLEKLPADRKHLTKKHHLFLKQVVDELAENNRITSVHLALFAEMFRYREWSLDELKNLGGLSAVATRFLIESFDSENSLAKFKDVRKSVRKILEQLLPESNIDLKGQKQSATLIKNALPSNLQSNFQQAIDVLETDLRLITRTDSIESSADGKINSKEVYYQLSHDYLVSAIRNWIHNTKISTLKGRTELRLKELLDQRNFSSNSSIYPSFKDFLFVSFLTSKKQMKPLDRDWWKKVTRFHVIRSTFASLLILAVGVLVFTLINNESRKTDSANLRHFISGSPGNATALLPKIAGISENLTDEVQQYLDGPDLKQRIRAAIALLRNTKNCPKFLNFIAKEIPSIKSQHEFRFVLQSISPFPTESKNELRKLFHSTLNKNISENRIARVRTAIALLALGDLEAVEEIASNRKDPTESTLLAFNLGNYFPDTESIIDLVSSNQLSEDAKFVLLKSCFYIDSNDWTEETQKRWNVFLRTQFESNPDSGTHSMCRFLAKKWRVELPVIKPTQTPRPGFNWWKVEVIPNINITFVRINPGTHQRKLSSVQGEIIAALFPKKTVQISKPFWIADQETPFSIFLEWMNSEPEISEHVFHERLEKMTIKERLQNFKRTERFFLPENHPLPVFTICYTEVLSCIDWINRRKEGVRSSFRFTLPTGDQWEYACQNGASTFFHFGDTSVQPIARDYAVVNTFRKDTTYQTSLIHFPHTKLPTRNGLSDMHGNLAEFVNPSDLKIQLDPERCFIKGGTLASPSQFTAFFTGATAPRAPFNYFGFRLILTEQHSVKLATN